MKNYRPKASIIEAVTQIFNRIELAVNRQGITWRDFSNSLGMHHCMFGRHVRREVTPSCEVFLQELLEAGFKITITHEEHPHINWDSEKDYKKHLNVSTTENAVVVND